MYRELPSPCSTETGTDEESGRPGTGAVDGGTYRGGRVGFSRVELDVGSPSLVRSEDPLVEPRGILEANTSLKPCNGAIGASRPLDVGRSAEGSCVPVTEVVPM